MMRHISFLFLFALLAFSASAQIATQRISLTISITNRPVTSNTLVVNSSTRIWTNASSATTILTNLVSTAQAATNLYNQIAGFPYSGGIFPQWLSETSMVLRAPLGAALSASQSGAWAILTLSTQAGPQTFTALWPIENIPFATNRTNQASSLVGGLSSLSTNAFATNSTATSNFITKGASPRQHVAAPITLNGGLSGIIEKLTNGYGTNQVFDSPKTTNLVNYGNAIRSEGAGGNSFQMGSNAMALGLRSMAVGNGAIATNDDSMAVGTDSRATNNNSTAFGNGSKALDVGATAVGAFAKAKGLQNTAVGFGAITTNDNSTAVGEGSFANHTAQAFGATASASGTNSLAIGGASSASGEKSVAIGNSSMATHSNSVAIGTSATTTANDQIRIGTSTQTVSIPGVLAIDGTQTNTTFRGTNVFNARIDFTSRANSGLANGLNPGVVLGTNTFVRMSGATTLCAISGFAAEQDGSFHIVQLSGPITNVICNETSALGTDATAANRIVTGTGADLALTNSPLVFGVIYDATASRWRLLSFYR